MIRRFVKWFLASVWPWIVKHVWPEIRKRLTAIFAKIMDDMESAFYEWSAARHHAATTHAEGKAAEAESIAEKCATGEDAKEHRAIAQVWREIAEDFRRENEELKAKLNEMLRRAKSTFVRELNALDVENIIQQSSDGSLRLSGSGVRLSLPAPAAASLNGRNKDKRETDGVKDGMVPVAELRQIADKLGLGEQIPDELLCAAINHVIDAIMSDDDELLSDEDESDD